MKYADGTVAHVGDRVRIINGDRGIVLASIDTGEYSSEVTKQEWEHLETGIIVRTDAGAIVHFEDPLSPGLLSRDQGLEPGAR